MTNISSTVKNSQLLLQHSKTFGLTSLKVSETEESIRLLDSIVYFLYHFIQERDASVASWPIWRQVRNSRIGV